MFSHLTSSKANHHIRVDGGLRLHSHVTIIQAILLLPQSEQDIRKNGSLLTCLRRKGELSSLLYNWISVFFCDLVEQFEDCS